MGKRKSYRPRKRKFHGNRYTSVPKAVSEVSESSFFDFESTSNTSKLLDCDANTSKVNEEELSGSRNIDINTLANVFSILCCPLCLSPSLYLCEESSFGLSPNLTLKCKGCNFNKEFSASKKENEAN